MLSKISFGRIVKVNAPVETAKKVVAMSREHTKVGGKLSKILYGNRKTNACTYSFPNNQEESYIFTGDDASAFLNYKQTANEQIDYAHGQGYYGISELTRRDVESIWQNFANNVRGIINSSPDNISELEVEYDNNERIKQIKSIYFLI